MNVTRYQQDAVPGCNPEEGNKTNDGRDANGTRAQPDAYHPPDKGKGQIKQNHKCNPGVFKFLVQQQKYDYLNDFVFFLFDF